MSNPKDVVIAGAEIAGLTAADELQGLGVCFRAGPHHVRSPEAHAQADRQT